MKRILTLALGVMIGMGLVVASASRPIQDIFNDVYNDTFRGLRASPSLYSEGTLHSGATSTGASSAVVVAGFKGKTVQLVLSGTATVAVETRLRNGTYRPVVGCTLSVDGENCSLPNLAFYEMRTNITACTGCTVTTRYQLDP
jgi:hypothetical protein